MAPFIELIKAVVTSYGQLLLDPLSGLLFLVVLTLVGTQYARIEAAEKRAFGWSVNRALPQMVRAMVFGLAGGLVCSVLLVLIGVSLTNSGVQYVLPTALVLYLLNPRFLCFSYAGGLLSLVYLAVGWPPVNVPVITGLVGCLHAVESLLIRVSGSTCSSPVILRRKDGNAAGGFVLQRFWPVPLILLALTTIPEGSQLGRDLIVLPDWWPLLRGPIPEGPGVPVFVMVPVMAGLGYSDLALTAVPEERARQTSRVLALYSGTLVLLAVISTRLGFVRWVAAVFAPLVHELIIQAGIRREQEGEPYFVTEEGLGAPVLEVIPDTPAARSGLKRGAVITSISGMPVTRETLSWLRETTEVTLEVKETKFSSQANVVRLFREGAEPFGFLPAPMPDDQPLMELRRHGILVTLIERVLSGLRRR